MRIRRRFVPLAIVVSVVAGSCGGGGGGEHDDAAPPTTASSCSPSATVRAGSLVINGLERTFALTLPTPRPASPAPLVVLFHGHSGNGPQIAATSGLPDAAAGEGFAVVVPDGLGDPARWNFDGRPGGPDDGAFLDALVTELAATGCVDPGRVALVGSSNGAAFAGTQACQAAAVVMVIATLPPDCPGAPPPVLTIRGTADATVAYDGTPELVAALASDAGCDADAAVDAPHPGVERTTYSGCAGGASVILDTVDGAVHTWPGGPEARRPDNSEAGRTFDATAEVVAFLRTALGPA